VIEYKLALAAERDLIEIEVYITQDRPAAAESVIDSIEAACQLIAEHPGVGRHRDEIAPDVMSFPVASFVIYYTAEENRHVEIARILHGKRDAGPAFRGP
jgi:toxin ParE1/3/4